MPRSVLPSTVIAAVALLAVVAMTGCTPQPTSAPTGTATKTTTAKPSPSATATEDPLPADVIFQITATATSPSGATATLVETVHAPVDATTDQTADEQLLDTQCDSWRKAFPTIKYVVADVTTTVTAGSWNSDDIVVTDMAGYPVWTGDQRPFQAYCASAIPSVPGTTRAVSPVGGGDPDSDGGWGIYRYGFGIPTDPAAGSTASPSDVTLSDCRIQLGSAASDSVFAGTWPATTQPDGGLTCQFGGTAG